MKTILKACAALGIFVLLTACPGSGGYANATTGSGYSNQTSVGRLPISTVAAQPDAADEQSRIARIKACVNRVTAQATSQCISEVVGGHAAASPMVCAQFVGPLLRKCIDNLEYWDSHPGELDAVVATESVNADNDGLAHYGESDNGRTIRVQQGTRFDVRLAVVSAFGDLDWSWDENENGSASVVAVDDPFVNNVEGRKDYMMEAVGQGKVTVVFQLNRQSAPQYRESSDPRCQSYHYERHHTCLWQLPPPPPVKTVRITFDITN